MYLSFAFHLDQNVMQCTNRDFATLLRLAYFNSSLILVKLFQVQINLNKLNYDNFLRCTSTGTVDSFLTVWKIFFSL